MKEIERLRFVQDGEPSKSPSHVRYVVEFFSTQNNAQAKIPNLLLALCVVFGTVSKDSQTISDMHHAHFIYFICTEAGPSTENGLFLDPRLNRNMFQSVEIVN